MHSQLGLLALAATFATSTASAQTITTLVKDGDVISTYGVVTDVLQVAVNNSGQWLVHANTVLPTASLFVVIRGGTAYLHQGQTLVPGGALSLVGPLSINSAGNAGWVLVMDSLPSNVDAGVFFNTSLVIQEGDISLATTGQDHFSPNTPYKAWFGAQINDNGQILTASMVDDPNIAGLTNPALVVTTINGFGSLVSEAVLCRQGSSLGTSGQTVLDFSLISRAMAINNVGQSIFVARMTGPAATDQYVVTGTPTQRIVRAQEGQPSPIAGRNYSSLSGGPVDINDHGEFVFQAYLDGSGVDSQVLIKNAAVVVARRNSPVPGIPGFTLTSFGTGALQMDNSSNVFWFGSWNDPDTTRDTGIFRNGQLLVQEGVTTVGGMVIEHITDTEYNFAVSPNGRYLIFRGRLQGGVDAVFLMDLGTTGPTAYCFGDGAGAGCPCTSLGNPGQGCPNSVNAHGANLTVTSGTASLSNDTLVLTGSGMPNGAGLYFQGTTRINSGNGVVFGDGLRCVAGTTVRLKPVTAVNGASMYPGAGDPSISMKGMIASPGVRDYQLWYRNAAVFCTSATFNLTNAIEVSWAP